MSKLIRSKSEVIALYLRTLYIKEIWGGEGDEGTGVAVPDGGRRTRIIS